MSVAINAITQSGRLVREFSRNRLFQLSMLTAGATALTSSSAAAQDAAGEAGKQAADLAAQKMEEAKNTFMNAIFENDRDAQIALFTEYLIPVIIAAGVLFLGYIIASIVGRWIGGFISKQVDTTLGRFAGKVAKTMVMLFVVTGVLSYFGFDVTSLAALLAAVGFAVGMALSGTIGNFAAGIMLLLFRPFKVGDYVVMAGSEGTVEAIDLFTTQLNSADNRRLIVPNGEIFGATIENVTHNQYRRVGVSVGCDYSADLDHTREVLEAAMTGIVDAVSEPAPQAYLCDLGDSSVNWQVRVWCKPADYWAVRERLTYATKKALDAAEIGIPFPQMDVHMQQVDGGAPQKPRRREVPVVQTNVSGFPGANANV